jgi:hypothetical protein
MRQLTLQPFTNGDEVAPCCRLASAKKELELFVPDIFVSLNDSCKVSQIEVKVAVVDILATPIARVTITAFEVAEVIDLPGNCQIRIRRIYCDYFSAAHA